MNELKKVYDKNKAKTFFLSTEISRSFSIFAGKVKKAIESDASEKGMQLAKFNKGHYDFSGFITRPDGGIFYFSMPQVTGTIKNKLMFRTAKSLTDYTGGTNQWTDFENLVSKIATAKYVA